jgi:hypothetical protein
MSDPAETADVIVVGGGQSQIHGRTGPLSIRSATTNVAVIMLAQRIYQRVYAS